MNTQQQNTWRSQCPSQRRMGPIPNPNTELSTTSSPILQQKSKGKAIQRRGSHPQERLRKKEEWKARKLGVNLEGPYLISKIVKPNVYQLMEIDGTAVPCS